MDSTAADLISPVTLTEHNIRKKKKNKEEGRILQIIPMTFRWANGVTGNHWQRCITMECNINTEVARLRRATWGQMTITSHLANPRWILYFPSIWTLQWSQDNRIFAFTWLWLQGQVVLRQQMRVDTGVKFTVRRSPLVQRILTQLLFFDKQHNDFGTA